MFQGRELNFNDSPVKRGQQSTVTTALTSGEADGLYLSIGGQAASVSTINGRIAPGTNITISGAGTAASPYTISSSTDISAHIAAPDPHTQYLTEAEADVLYAPIGGGGGLNQGTATIDFGAFPGSNEASVSFTNAAVGAFVIPFFASDETTADHTANDHKYAAMLVQLSAQTTPGVGGTIYARSQEKMQGTFDVRYGY